MSPLFLLPLLVLDVAVARVSDEKFFNSKPNRPASPQRQWAILVAGSKTYTNYRHQADICHAYQLLRDRGMRDERIVVMMYDDIANNTENPTPGVIINHPEGPNVYQGVAKDYTGDLVTPENFLKILQGEEVDGGSGKVIASDRYDHIFIFFSGHGGPGLLDFPNGGALKASRFLNTIMKMHREKRYQRMVIYVEACHSGSLFDRLLPNNLNVYATTAAKPYQNSFSCYYDSYRNVPLGDEYSVKWMEHAEENDLIATSLRTQFAHVQRETEESHVMEYGDISIARLQVSRFLGRVKPKPLLRRKLPCASTSNADVAIAILRNKADNARQPSAKKYLEEKLKKTMDNRAFLRGKVAEIVELIAREKENITKLPLSSRKRTKNMDCYEDAEPNVYQGVAKDYTGDLVTPDNFLHILQGVRVKGGSGKVIASGRNDYIFIFFSGHGGPFFLDLPNGGALTRTQLINKI
ncbi:hypothetical protein V5799_021374 [Amblyomma americanum]|uniref:legumain n=1 Tax=Amblyomma americanum TaxID=6943 RepID=A0AAQ4FPY8_AMBAM